MSDDPIRIFAGCDPNYCDLEQMMVLEHSLRRRCSLPVELHWMRLSRDPSSPWHSDAGRGWRTERWATPFSGFRWAVPAQCGFRGRALYMDTDMLALGDLAELWRTPIAEPAVAVARRDETFTRYCVVLWDCERAARHLPALDALQRDPGAHQELIRRFNAHPDWVQPMDPAWNCIDGEHRAPGQIRLLHYSDMSTQFTHDRAFARLAANGQTHWFDGPRMAHPRADLAALFDAEYADALAAGRHLDDYRAAQPYGAFAKKSERRYAGNPITQPQRWRPRFRWPWA